MSGQHAGGRSACRLLLSACLVVVLAAAPAAAQLNSTAPAPPAAAQRNTTAGKRNSTCLSHVTRGYDAAVLLCHSSHDHCKAVVVTVFGTGEVLLGFREGISNWAAVTGDFQGWTDATQETCSWTGVACNNAGEVTGL